MISKKGGRNSSGKITIRHRGGGAKRLYRMVDFKRQKLDVWAEVSAIEYDPNRGARIVLMQYEDGQKAYFLAWDGVKVGDKVISTKEKIDTKKGYQNKR